MDYLDIIIYPFAVDWSDVLTSQMIYDDRYEEIGYGRGITQLAQAYERRGMVVNSRLSGEEDMQMFDAFLAQTSGRLGAFWLATQLRDVRILGAGGSQAFRIGKQDFDTTWQLTPRSHIELLSPEGDVYQAQIADVVDVDDTQDEVQLAAALPVTVDAGWSVSLLLLMRRSGDELTLEIEANKQGVLRLQAVEIPFEYLEAPDVSFPVYLYQFTRRFEFDIDVYRLTSYESDIEADGATWYASPIDHGQISTSTQGDTDAGAVRLFAFDGNPFEDWLPVHIGPPIELSILEAEIKPETGLLVTTPAVIYRGMVRGLKRKGAVIDLDLVDAATIAGAALPDEPITSLCPLKLYDINTCGVIRSEFALEGEIMAIDAEAGTIDVESVDLDDKPADWLIGERIERGERPDLEIRTVEDATILTATRHRLHLNWPFRLAEVNDTVKGYAGCNRTPTHCHERFDNFARYGGNIDMPEENLTLKAIPLAPGSGGKK